MSLNIKNEEAERLARLVAKEADETVTEAVAQALRERLARLRARRAVNGALFTAIHASVARDAWLRFGEGRHPAGLYIGDCCSYAPARHAGLPLLFKGDDSSRTDLQLVSLEPTEP